MAIRIALAGNPNCGKTTLFNALTGSNQFVGNWPGVTVEKKEGRLKKAYAPDISDEITIVDLPGIYSLSPYTPEEVVARNYLISDRPDAVINIVDGTNIERNLYLSTQIMELGIPVVLAVNMTDVLARRGDRILADKLGTRMGCEVVEISALKGSGISKAAEKAVAAARRKEAQAVVHTFSDAVEEIIWHAADRLGAKIKPEQRRFFAIRLLEKDDRIFGQMAHVPDVSEEIRLLEERFEDDTESIITNERYAYISSVTEECVKKAAHGEKMTASDRIDRVVTNRIFALPIFAAVMFLVYYVSVTTIGDWLTGWTNDTLFGAWIIPGVAGGLEAAGCAGWLTGLIADGIVGGVGAVLGFVPQMLVLFFFLAFLEACGYMARVAFIMDRVFRRFGLSGKSFIPMLIGSGCGVPGIMASRTIESDRDRKMTIITTTFIPCGAKLPIIALIAGAFFDNAGWVAWSAYFVGIGAVVCSGILLKKMRIFAGDPAPFVMELPAYHMPAAVNVLRSMWERGWSFIRKAGTIILLSTIVLWFLQGFGWSDGSFGMLGRKHPDSSILAVTGRAIAPLFAPLGWGDWRMAVAAVTGLIAKENVVATSGILFGFAEVTEDGAEIWTALAGAMSGVGAYSFLVFNLLCAPCFAAMGAIRREMNSAKWFWSAIGYQTILAYIVSMCIYQIGTWITERSFGTGTAVSLVCVAVFICLLFRPDKESGVLKMNLKKTARAQ